MDLRAGSHTSWSPLSPRQGRGGHRYPPDASRPQDAGGRGKPDLKVASSRGRDSRAHSPGTTSLRLREFPRRETAGAAPPLPPPGPRRPPPAAGRRPPRVPSPAPGRRPNGRGGAGGWARGALSASPAPTQPSPPVPAAAGLAREGTKRLREAAASTEEEARWPLSGVTLAPRSPLPRINKIFKMAVREGKRECGGQSGPRAGSWRARVGEAGRPGASAGSPDRGGAARGRLGRGRQGCEAWLVGCLLAKRAGRVPGGRPASGLIARTLGGLPGYCPLGSFPEKGGSLRPGGGGRLVVEKFPFQEVATYSMSQRLRGITK